MEISIEEYGFNKICENNTEAIFLLNTSGIILYCNKIASDMFGYNSPEEIKKINVTELVPEDFAKLFPEEISKEHLTKGRFLKRVNKRKNGSLFASLVKTSLIILNKISYIKTIVKEDIVEPSDLTKRKLEQNIEILKCELEKEKNKSKSNFDIQDNSQYNIMVDYQFRKKLTSQFNNLTNKEVKLASYIYIDISTKNIADIMGISVNSVYVSRKRLRKKLNLNNQISLLEFISNIIDS